MKREFKIGNLTITPKMTLAFILALFILGIGIGVTVASPGNSLFALFVCVLISGAIIFYTLLRSS